MSTIISTTHIPNCEMRMLQYLCHRPSKFIQNMANNMFSYLALVKMNKLISFSTWHDTVHISKNIFHTFYNIMLHRNFPQAQHTREIFNLGMRNGLSALFRILFDQKKPKPKGIRLDAKHMNGNELCKTLNRFEWFLLLLLLQ